jgi:hypothetical protein
MPEGLSPIEVGKELHEHTKEPHEHAAPTAATAIRASCRSARRCCSRRPVDPQLRLVDLHRLVHRVHVERSPEAGGRRAALPAGVQGRIRRLDGHRPVPQPASRGWAHLHAPVQARRPGQGRRAGPRGRTGGGGGNHAAVVGDDYVRITVFLAAVLFLVGIGSTFKLPTVRYVLIVVGAVLLVLATVLILWCCGAANAGREGSRSARPWSSRRDPGCRVPRRVPAAPLPSAPRREWAFGGGCRAPWPAWS